MEQLFIVFYVCQDLLRIIHKRTEDVEGIHVHKYGAHIFHTNNKKVWNYITTI